MLILKSLSLNIWSETLFLFALLFTEETVCDVVFQPSLLVASGPRASAFLVGNLSDVSLSISSVSPSNTTGRLPPPSCGPSSGVQWNLTQELIGKSGLVVRLSLNRNLLLCVSENEAECCAQLLCVRETLRVSACVGEVPQASLTVQAQIFAQLPLIGPVSENKTTIPNPVFQPLGRCPCDLTPKVCDVKCCCDQDCTAELLWLFAAQCLPGPFGGTVTPGPDYTCSVQSAENAPDWFPFLCVTSSSENNPFLGLFYHGSTVTPKPAPSFQAQQAAAPVPPANYRQGAPIFTTDNQYFTIPQVSLLGQCLENAPVAFLQDFEAVCVTVLQSCPAAPPELGVTVRDGQGGAGVVTVSVVDEAAQDVSDQGVWGELCLNVVLSLSYTFYWRGNSITGITVTRRVGNISFRAGVSVSTRYSGKFVNGNVTAQKNSGNPGYQVSRPVIGGVMDSSTGAIRRAPVNIWQPVGDGLCSSADLRPVLYGLNSTSGCLIPVSLHNITQCIHLREMVCSMLTGLVPATLVSSSGKPDFFTLANWTSITTVVQNSSQAAPVSRGVCSGVPAHLHIHIRSRIIGTIGGVPQKIIQAVELNFKESTWTLECAAAQGGRCMSPNLTQTFPVMSFVTFTDAPINNQPPMSRFRINFTEFDCDRNDVCWPELAFPLTPSYTGEPFSQSLAKGLILVFLVMAASVLGTPWRQIRQAWRSSAT